MIYRSSLFAFLLMIAPQVARADYLDVIVNSLNPACTLEQYMAAVDGFRGVMKSQNYKYSVEISTPLMNPELNVVYWLGRAPTLTDFGEGYTRWEAEIAKSGTPEAKANDALNKCTTNVSRSGHLTR